MPPDFWALLAEPFSRASCSWRVVEVADDLLTARLERTLTRAAIAERLDAAVGASHWSFHLLPLGERSLICNLTVAGVGRAGTATAVPALKVDDAGLLAESALAAAAQQFGMRADGGDQDVSGSGSGGGSTVWVDFDAESGEALYLPDDGPDTERGGQDAAVGASPVVGGEPARTIREPPAEPRSAVTGSDPKPAGHEVIERLLDRLREEGLGKEAARLVVTHGGYGRSQAESRELYGKLRALLLSAAEVPSS